VKFLFLLCSVGFTFSAKAADLNCVLQEDLKGQTSMQTVVIPASDDPHGAISNFNLTKYPDYSGFTALSKGFIVINLVNNNTGVGTSVQSKASNDNPFARLQLILGVNDGNIDEIVIQCGSVE
jgi:hypothetical protein